MTTNLFSIKELSEKIEAVKEQGEISFNYFFEGIGNNYVFNFDFKNTDFEDECDAYNTIGVFKTYATYSDMGFTKELLQLDKLSDKLYDFSEKLEGINLLIFSQEDLVKSLDKFKFDSRSSVVNNNIKKLTKKFNKIGSKYLFKHELYNSKLETLIANIEKTKSKTKEQLLYEIIQMKNSNGNYVYDAVGCKLFRTINKRIRVKFSFTIPKKLNPLPSIEIEINEVICAIQKYRK